MRLAVPHPVRIALVAVLAMAGAWQAVRTAVVTHAVGSRPALAAKLWPGHPRVQLALAMTDIGTAAGAGRAPAANSIAQGLAASRRAPLSIQPFLIRGAALQSQGRDDLAEPVFVEASRRDPRSSAARFFLAQRYLSSGRAGEGLRHASVLVRLVSGGSGVLVPAIAQYARAPDAAPALARMFEVNPALRDEVLAALARDADNLDLVLKLADRTPADDRVAAAPAWQAELLRSLVERGDYDQAHALWRRISGINHAPAGIFNPQFARLSAPAPFNWSFASGDFGVAEPAAGDSLQLLYYGRTNAEFASQTLLLAPGTYALSMRVLRTPDGEGPSGLAWSLTCPSRTGAPPLLALPLGSAAGAAQTVTGRFTVPAACRAQLLKLAGTAREPASSEQVTISNLQLVRQAP